MASNDQIILDQALEQERARRAPSSPKGSFFEMYVAEQLLKDADLSDEEIESGLVGDGGDGGIDGIYIFANGELVREDFDASSLKKSVVLEVVIIQSKLAPERSPMSRWVIRVDFRMSAICPVCYATSPLPKTPAIFRFSGWARSRFGFRREKTGNCGSFRPDGPTRRRSCPGEGAGAGLGHRASWRGFCPTARAKGDV